MSHAQIESYHYLSMIFAGVVERKKKAARMDELLRFEKFLAEISATYINLPAHRIEEVIKYDFERVARLLGVDRCILYMFDEHHISFKFNLPFIWWPERDDALVQEHIKRLREDTHFFDDYQYFFDQWRKGRIIQFQFLEELPEEASAAKALYQGYGAKSSLSVPVSVGGEIMGALAVSTVRAHRSWSEDVIQRVRVFADIFVNAMVRKWSEEKLQKAFSEINHLKERIEADYTYLKEEINLEYNFGDIVGKSDALRRILIKVKQVAPTNATVLLMGETGTGKGLIGRTIHNYSKRKSRPFMQVNCAALNPGLIESELFGHEKGAFTGARTMHQGRFETADGTTLFLDEVGELSLALQAKLLHVIEDGELERVGGAAAFGRMCG